MKLPAPLKEFLPFSPPFAGEEEILELADAVRSGWLTKGPRTELFERKIAEFIGASESLSLSSCTAALHLGLRVLNVGPGDGVVTTPLTFVSTAHAILYVGALPFFADVDPLTGNLSPEKARAFLENDCVPGPKGRRRARAGTGRTVRAILPVHYGGNPLELDKFDEIAREFKLDILEDAAHAFGSKIGDDFVGGDALLGRGKDGPRRLAAFSFYATKNLATGEGGLLTANDPALLARARILSSYGISDARRIWEEKAGAPGKVARRRHPWDYDVRELGFKTNFTDLGAALGLAQLRKYPAMAEARRRIAGLYEKHLGALPDLATLPEEREGTTHSRHLYPVLFKTEALLADRDRILEMLADLNIGTSVMFKPIHLFSHYRKLLGIPRGTFPAAEDFSERVASLPVSPGPDPETSAAAARKTAELLLALKK
ncbi:MAG: DegT/DnrJ/EryC1/StrS family aminotransferase [Deltaproteobacteria bacterium]|jgi:dTDP-4-amino-4,6-dideoxygalactose transaminase|nr:DegT/DnrJ/EryC1/StrS family aminotransferase [Deltaproteobacteria bacterium]